MSIRVVIADRSPFVRVAVRGELADAGIEVVGEAGDAAGALRKILAERPDAVLFDAELDEEMDVIAFARRELPGAALIVLSPDASEARAIAAVEAGACGFVPKDTAPARLPDIVRGAVAGEAAIPRRLVRGMLERFASRPAGRERVPAGTLTARESEVLELLAGGMTDACIGESLGVSEITVRRHAATAARKLHAVRREDAVAAFRRLVV